MFHGPAYQGVVSLETLGSNGITGTLRTGAAEGALLDNAGQLFGLWVMCTQERDRLAMPVQIESLRFYGPHPAPGTLVRCDIRIRMCKSREVIADMQCWVGDRCWADIRGWEDWRFETDERLWPLLQFPERHLLAEPLEGDVWTMNLQSRSRRSLDDLSRRFLCREDRERWQAMKPLQKPSWLAGRIAAIDAIRSLLFGEGRREVFPLEVRVTNEASGRPRVTIRGETEPVHVSIAHKDGMALAQASRREGIGVDLERIEPRTDGFIQLAFADDELNCLPAEDREGWVTRAWCAKESVGKGQGSGLDFSPKSWVLEGREGNRLRVNGVWVETRVAEGYGMAWIDEEHS
jgi:phosphopantetheinyl transferase